MCGVVGVFSPDGRAPVAELAGIGTHVLQNRGPEGAGLTVVQPGLPLQGYRGLGKVLDVMPDRGAVHDTILPHATAAIGQSRYPTDGADGFEGTQPIHYEREIGAREFHHRVFATNGNVANSIYIDQLFGNGTFQPTDSNYSAATLNAVADKYGMLSAIQRVAPHHDGAFASIWTDGEQMHGWRDPWGFRPLMVGRLASGDVVFGSEAPAVEAMGAVEWRDVRRGEIVSVGKDGVLRSSWIKREIEPGGGICGLEFAYLAGADGWIEGRNIYEARVEMGRRLARLKPMDADVVMHIPDSGLYAALGYSQESGIPYAPGIIRVPDSPRTFLGRTQEVRARNARGKFRFVKAVIDGKRTGVVDDTLLRGTVSTVNTAQIRRAGATEVHMRLSAPMVRDRCAFGIRIDTQRELIANVYDGNEEKIADHIGADSVGYLPPGAFRRSIDLLDLPLAERAGKSSVGSVCTACMTRRYPITLPDEKVPSADQTPLYGPHS